MSGKQPNIIFLYRIVHIDNLEYLLTHGMFTRHHIHADPSYINIGDAGLIVQRNNYPVAINPPNGVLGDYVPFYFGPLSPMLLNIKTGHRGITKRPQEEIVYIVCKLETIISQCDKWCFTDRHAKDKLVEFYNNIDDLDKVFWDVVSLRYWHPIEDFIDRQVRKQAEFLVRDYVPVQCIEGIIVYNNEASKKVNNIIKKEGINLPIKVNPNNNYYY